MTHPATFELRPEAEALVANLPPLLAQAQQLAAAVQMGAHGRRQAGVGDEFWQYRPALDFDEARHIDWRRSARSDQHFLREMEWQATQSVYLWVDSAQSMEYSSASSLASKAARARLLALATAILLERAGERIGLADAVTPPRSGPAQLTRIASAMLLATSVPVQEYGVPSQAGMVSGARTLLLSDFFGDLDAIEAMVHAASDRGISGAMVQVLDPEEMDFPFSGRAVFESMGGTLQHDTKEAGGLRTRYRQRLAERQDRLQTLSKKTGWHWQVHCTQTSAIVPMVWIYAAIGLPAR